MPIPKPPGILADFDSSSGMLRALARFLHGQAYPALGLPGAEWKEPGLRVLGSTINHLPKPLQRAFYVSGGWNEAIRPAQLADLDAEQIARWVVDSYPNRRYPAVLIGSSNGALVHLAALMGIPWLPQTSLIPVRHDGHDTNAPKQDLEWGLQHGPTLLKANPHLALHHMHDPNQDQLMTRRMTYFRVKWQQLPGPYRRFLDECLEPDGTVILVECDFPWPTTRISDRQVFQFGALGGLTPDEYRSDDPRIAAFLREQGAPQRRWDAPEPDDESPEAEWGFDHALRLDVTSFASQRGLDVRRLRFDHPMNTSPMVADLYRRHYADRGLLANRLMIESFLLLEPFWALRTGSVPFWTVFAVEQSASAVESYLDQVEPFDEIHAMLFSHGVKSVGVAPPERWRPILDQARRRGGFLGVDEDVFPRDFATLIHYHRAIPRTIPARYPLPGPMTLAQLDRFLTESADRWPVRWSGTSSAPDPERPVHSLGSNGSHRR